MKSQLQGQAQIQRPSTLAPEPTPAPEPHHDANDTANEEGESEVADSPPPPEPSTPGTEADVLDPDGDGFIYTNKGYKRMSSFTDSPDPPPDADVEVEMTQKKRFGDDESSEGGVSVDQDLGRVVKKGDGPVNGPEQRGRKEVVEEDDEIDFLGEGVDDGPEAEVEKPARRSGSKRSASKKATNRGQEGRPSVERSSEGADEVGAAQTQPEGLRPDSPPPSPSPDVDGARAVDGPGPDADMEFDDVQQVPEPAEQPSAPSPRADSPVRRLPSSELDEEMYVEQDLPVEPPTVPTPSPSPPPFRSPLRPPRANRRSPVPASLVLPTASSRSPLKADTTFVLSDGDTHTSASKSTQLAGTETLLSVATAPPTSQETADEDSPSARAQVSQDSNGAPVTKPSQSEPGEEGGAARPSTTVSASASAPSPSPTQPRPQTQPTNATLPSLDSEPFAIPSPQRTASSASNSSNSVAGSSSSRQSFRHVARHSGRNGWLRNTLQSLPQSPRRASAGELGGTSPTRGPRTPPADLQRRMSDISPSKSVSAASGGVSPSRPSASLASLKMTEPAAIRSIIAPAVSSPVPPASPAPNAHAQRQSPATPGDTSISKSFVPVSQDAPTLAVIEPITVSQDAAVFQEPKSSPAPEPMVEDSPQQPTTDAISSPRERTPSALDGPITESPAPMDAHLDEDVEMTDNVAPLTASVPSKETAQDEPATHIERPESPMNLFARQSRPYGFVAEPATDGESLRKLVPSVEAVEAPLSDGSAIPELDHISSASKHEVHIFYLLFVLQFPPLIDCMELFFFRNLRVPRHLRQYKPGPSRQRPLPVMLPQVWLRFRSRGLRPSLPTLSLLSRLCLKTYHSRALGLLLVRLYPKLLSMHPRRVASQFRAQ